MRDRFLHNHRIVTIPDNTATIREHEAVSHHLFVTCSNIYTVWRGTFYYSYSV